MAAMIDKYESGRLIQINGKAFHHDVKIIGSEVKSNWWRKQGHRLDATDIEDILAFRPEVRVIGTGFAEQMKVPSSTRAMISNSGIRIETQNTNHAVQIFNRLHKEGRKVAGAFHLTC